MLTYHIILRIKLWGRFYGFGYNHREQAGCWKACRTKSRNYTFELRICGEFCTLQQKRGIFICN